jgi:thymidylate synthase
MSTRTMADFDFGILLGNILKDGDIVSTRNAVTKSLLGETVKLYEFPLITWRKTAVKKALLEMEWFMSGDPLCPKELRDWWNGQLYRSGSYIDGYPKQFRRSSFEDDESECSHFDQVGFILNGLKNNPASRRLILTTWNPGEMANITRINENPLTPTSCHNTCTQFFVRNDTLHMTTYQRSADVLLGVPHNWVQTWAMGVYFAHHAGLKMGSIVWHFGDAHIYQEESHIRAAQAVMDADIGPTGVTPKLEYKYSGEVDSYGTPKFLAADFEVVGDIPPPVTTIRPKLL